MKTCMNCVYYNCKLNSNYNVETNTACIYWTDKIEETYPNINKSTSNNEILREGEIDGE